MGVRKIKQSVRRILLLSVWVSSATLFIVILSSSIASQKGQSCKNICIKIDHNTGLFFIEENDIKSTILAYCGDSLNNMKVRDADFAEIEQRLEKNPYISNVEIYSNIKGSVNVEIKQREPLMRVVNNKGVSFYIDRFGEIMPLSSKFTARVVVATGDIDNEADKEILQGLYRLAEYISEDKFWNAQFEQIYVTENREIELVPKLGKHIIKIGKVEDLESKFEKLMIFYTEVLKNVEADAYKMVNVKFKDQIICSKR